MAALTFDLTAIGPWTENLPAEPPPARPCGDGARSDRESGVARRQPAGPPDGAAGRT